MVTVLNTKPSKTPAGIARQARLKQQLKSPKQYQTNGRHKVQNTKGREKGVPNQISRLTREAIFEGLSRCGGKEGMVGFVIRATEDNLKNGVAMLNMITPRIVDAVVTHNDMIIKTLADVDTELAARGLPSTQEIFKLDYKGDTDPEEMEIVEGDTKE